MGQATKLRNDAYSALDRFGKQVAYSAGEGEGISQFSYFKTTKNETGDLQPTPFLSEIQKANRGAYKPGDVVLVQQKVNGIMTTRIKVYTGLPVAQVDYQNKKLYDLFHDAGEYLPE